MYSAKGQAFSPDFIIASVIFLLILIMLNTYTNSMYEKIEKQENMIYYETLLSTTDIMMLYGGYPENWNSTNVEVIGLAGRPNYINRTKLETMVNGISNNRIKELLGIEDRSFNITVRNGTSTLYTKGGSDWSNSKNIYVVKRRALMDEQEIEISLLVW